MNFFFLGLNKYSFIKKKEKEHTKKGGPHSRTENDKFYYSIIGKAKVFKKRVYSWVLTCWESVCFLFMWELRECVSFSCGIQISLEIVKSFTKLLDHVLINNNCNKFPPFISNTFLSNFKRSLTLSSLFFSFPFEPIFWFYENLAKFFSSGWLL